MKTDIKSFLKKVIAVMSIVLIFGIPITQAQAADSTLQATVTAGSLALTADATVTLTTVAVLTTSQTLDSSPDLTNTYTNTEGDGTTWSATITAKRGGSVAAPVAGSGTTNSLTIDTTNTVWQPSTGMAPSSEKCLYTVSIPTGGAVTTTATYSVTLSGTGCSDGSMQSAVLTGASNKAVGNSGLKVNFPTASYLSTDSWTIVTDVVDYANLTINPAAPTATSGSTTGITNGSSGAFSGSGATSSSRTLASVTAGRGMGAYSQAVDFDVVLPSNPVTTASSVAYKWVVTVTLA